MVRSIRRIGSLASACVLAGAFAATPAHANTSTPEIYVGTASGKGLDVSILGQSATFGISSAKVTSALTAEAKGAGQALPAVTGAAGEQVASVTGGGSSDKTQSCATPAIPSAVSSILSVGLACSEAHASVVNGNPVATSTGSVGFANLNANTILNGTPLAPIVAAAQPVVDALTGLITQVNSALPQQISNLGVATTLQDLLNGLLTTNTLAVTIGDSTSTVTTEAAKVTSLGTASAATIKILPFALVNGTPVGEPVATIQVSSARATAAYDRMAGTSAASFDPAIARVHFNTALTNALGVQDITVPVGQTTTILAGTALESTITVANGSKVTNADGSVGAIADGVKLELLKGVNGGLVLNLAHAEAGVGGTPAVKVTQILPAVTDELPRTGGAPMLPIAGAGILALLVAVRRATTRTRAQA